MFNKYRSIRFLDVLQIGNTRVIEILTIFWIYDLFQNQIIEVDTANKALEPLHLKCVIVI